MHLKIITSNISILEGNIQIPYICILRKIVLLFIIMLSPTTNTEIIYSISIKKHHNVSMHNSIACDCQTK